MASIPEILGKNITRWRKVKQLTQKELAKEAGISRVTIVRYEAGTAGLDHKTISLIAGALGIEEVLLIDTSNTDHLQKIPKTLEEVQEIFEGNIRKEIIEEQTRRTNQIQTLLARCNEAAQGEAPEYLEAAKLVEEYLRQRRQKHLDKYNSEDETPGKKNA